MDATVTVLLARSLAGLGIAELFGYWLVLRGEVLYCCSRAHLLRNDATLPASAMAVRSASCRGHPFRLPGLVAVLARGSDLMARGVVFVSTGEEVRREVWTSAVRLLLLTDVMACSGSGELCLLSLDRVRLFAQRQCQSVLPSSLPHTKTALARSNARFGGHVFKVMRSSELGRTAYRLIVQAHPLLRPLGFLHRTCLARLEALLRQVEAVISLSVLPMISVVWWA